MERINLTKLAHPRRVSLRLEAVQCLQRDGRITIWLPVKPQPPATHRLWSSIIDGHAAWTDHPQGEKGRVIEKLCPLGALGDVFWEAETWAHDCPHCNDARCGNIDHIWRKANEHRWSRRALPALLIGVRPRPCRHGHPALPSSIRACVQNESRA